MHLSFQIRELMKAYPDAKVLLNVRNPDTWYDSVYNSIYRGYRVLFLNSITKIFITNSILSQN